MIMIKIIILIIIMILLIDNSSNDGSCNNSENISNDNNNDEKSNCYNNNSDNSSFDVKLVGKWVSLLFHVCYFFFYLISQIIGLKSLHGSALSFIFFTLFFLKNLSFNIGFWK